MKTAIWAALLASVFCLLTTCAPANHTTNIYQAASVDDDDDASPDPSDDDGSPIGDDDDNDDTSPGAYTCQQVYDRMYGYCHLYFQQDGKPADEAGLVNCCINGDQPWATDACVGQCIIRHWDDCDKMAACINICVS